MTKIICYKIESDNDFNENPRDNFEPFGTMVTWHNRYTLGGKEDQNNVAQPESIQEYFFDRFSPEFSDFGGYSFEYGSVYDKDYNEVEDTTEFYAAIDKWIEENVCIQNLYLYEHSGITIRCSPFSCGWDSGQVGFIYVTKEKAGDDWQNAETILKGEIATLDQYLTGDVWGYRSFEVDASDMSDEEFDDNFYRTSQTLAHIEGSDGLFIYLLDHDDSLPGSIECYKTIDSCWGFYGHDYLKSEIKSMAESEVNSFLKQQAKIKEQNRRLYFCM